MKRNEELQNEMNFTTFERVSEEILQIEEEEYKKISGIFPLMNFVVLTDLKAIIRAKKSAHF